MDRRQQIRQFMQTDLLNDSSAAIGDADNLLGDGLIDSLGMMQLVQFIEQAFEVPVPPEDVTIEHFMTLEAIDAYIDRRKR